MRSSLRILSLLLVLATPVARAQLEIRDGGKRVVAFSAPSCSYSMYSPSLLVDPDPAIPGRELVMYTAGGLFGAACSELDFMSPARFGDKIWYHYRDREGVWRDPDDDPVTVESILDRRSFPWMNDEQYILHHPQAYIGHLASPSVVKIGQRYFMIFVASINDPNLCAAEHTFIANPCGSCRSRWSIFTAMWAVSNDGLNWRVWEGSPYWTNRALNASVLWMPFYAPDLTNESMFKGLSRTSLMVREEEGKIFFYVGATFWGRERLKAGMFRLRYDPESEWGFSGNREVWDTEARRWRTCPGGMIPGWFNDLSARGSVFDGFFGNLSETRLFPGYRYIATHSANSEYSSAPGARGISNIITYQLSDNLVDWTPPEEVYSSIPYFADGTSYDVSVTDPMYLEERGFYHFFFASADGDEEAGVVRDGIHDCTPENYVDHPTAPYIGMGIYVGTGKLRYPPPDRDNKPSEK